MGLPLSLTLVRSCLPDLFLHDIVDTDAEEAQNLQEAEGPVERGTGYQ